LFGFGKKLYPSPNQKLAQSARAIIGTPDITVEYSGKPLIFIDAKNSPYSRGANIEQMNLYLNCGCDTRLFVHSYPPEGFWHRYTRNSLHIFYTHLTQTGAKFATDEYNNVNLYKLSELIKARICSAQAQKQHADAN
jgi:hypothetical protein